MRWLLLIIGLAIIAAILWDGFRRNRRLHVIQGKIPPKVTSVVNEPVKPQGKERVNKVAVVPQVDISLKKEQQLDFFEVKAPKEAMAESETKDVDNNIKETSEPQSGVKPAPGIEYLAIYVLADSEKHFKGQHILQTLLKVGCRFGEMNIFHRHVRLDGKGPIYFSVASIVQPGTFSIRNMKQCTTPGLTFFMPLDRPEKSVSTFQLMLQTAEQVSEYLGGHVCNEQRELLTKEQISRYRMRLELMQKSSAIQV